MLYFKSRGEKTPLRQSKSAGSSKVSADGIETEIHVDSTYNATSHNAQSGKAVAQATQQSLEKLTSQLGSVLRYKGSKATYEELTQLTQKETGDVYDITGGEQAGANYVWTGSEWDKLSEDLTKLVKQTVFDSLKTQIETHTKDQDTDAKHLDSTNYEKLQQVTVYSSESLDKLIDEVLQTYVTSGQLVTEESLQEQFTQVETTIQTSVVESVKTEMQGSFLTAETLNTYKTQVDEKKSHLIKCAQADTLDVYVEGDNRKAPTLSKRKARTIYLIGEGATVEDTDKPAEPTVDESKEFTIGLDMTTQNLGNQDNTYVLDLGPILGEFNGPDASGITQRARIDWGDGTATVEIGENVGRSNQILQHTYSLETHRSYNLKITGDIKWNSYHNNASAVSTTPIENSLGKVADSITIDNYSGGKTSPIRAIAPYAFENFTRIDRISERLLQNCTVASGEGLFKGCTNLDDVPTAFLFDACGSSITSIANIFNGCVKITKMPTSPSLFAPLVNLTDANHAFYNSGLTTIPDDLFSSCSQLQDVSYCFCCCENTEIPESLFSNCPHLKNCSHCFCEIDGEYTSSHHITSIPQGLFNSSVNSELDTFTECFEGCSGVTGNVPELWTMYSDASQCAGCFTGCENCQNWDEVPEAWGGPGSPTAMKLVIETLSENEEITLGYVLCGKSSNTEYSVNPEVIGGTIDWGEGSPTKFTQGNAGWLTSDNEVFKHTYTNAGEHTITISGKINWGAETPAFIKRDIRLRLKSIDIPENKCSPIYDISIRAFYSSSSLTSIPSRLFENCTKVTSFGSCFYACKALIAIPDKLFDNCPLAEDFSGLFAECTSLTTIPSGLFDKCTEATSFSRCFYYAPITEIPDHLFDHHTKAINFGDCFGGCERLTAIPEGLFNACNNVLIWNSCFSGCTQIKGMLPALWERYPDNEQHYYCFNHCTLADNYTAAQAAGWAD